MIKPGSYYQIITDRAVYYRVKVSQVTKSGVLVTWPSNAESILRKNIRTIREFEK